MSNQHRCVLGQGVCKVAGQEDECHSLCPAFIQLHGHSGNGGRIRNSNTPKEHKTIHLVNSPVREKQNKNYLVMDKYLKRLFEPRSEKENRLSLYLFSENTGTGKTTSAAALVHTYIVKHYLTCLQKRETPLLRPAYFLDANEWQTVYNQATRNNVPKDVAESAYEKYYEMLNTSYHVPFLVIDDLAVRDITPAHRGDLHSLINHRISESLPTVYTSNVPIEKLPEVFGEERLYDRIRDQCLILEFEGESMRGVGK